MLDIFSLSTYELVSKMKEGQISSIEVCKAYIERINKYENRRFISLFEVMWEDKSVGVYASEQEAENVAENYALGSSISKT